MRRVAATIARYHQGDGAVCIVDTFTAPALEPLRCLNAVTDSRRIAMTKDVYVGDRVEIGLQSHVAEDAGPHAVAIHRQNDARNGAVNADQIDGRSPSAFGGAVLRPVIVRMSRNRRHEVAGGEVHHVGIQGKERVDDVAVGVRI